MQLPDLIPLQQSDRYAATLGLLGRSTQLHDDGSGPPVLSVRRRFGPVSVSYLPRADLTGTRVRILRDLPRTALRLVLPEHPVPLPRCWPVLTGQHVAEINVPRPPVHENLWANMHGKWRNRLRRALDGPLEVRQSVFLPDRDAGLLALERAQRHHRGYRSYDATFFAAWATANPRQSALYEARLDGETVAFMLFLLHGPVATYAMGWTGPEGRRCHAHNRLMWDAMRSFFARGIVRIDLGTIDTEGGRDLARFKLGCGARARSLGPTLLAPPGFRVSP